MNHKPECPLAPQGCIVPPIERMKPLVSPPETYNADGRPYEFIDLFLTVYHFNGGKMTKPRFINAVIWDMERAQGKPQGKYTYYPQTIKDRVIRLYKNPTEWKTFVDCAIARSTGRANAIPKWVESLAEKHGTDPQTALERVTKELPSCDLINVEKEYAERYPDADFPTLMELAAAIPAYEENVNTMLRKREA